MGKRKTRKPPPKKVMPKLPTSFDCPFCNNEGTVECTINRKTSIGALACRICGAKYSTNITYINDPIDVYSEWIDECEKVNANRDEDEDEDEVGPTQQQQMYHHDNRQQQVYQDDEEDEEGEEEDDGPTQHQYAAYNRGGY